MKKDLPKARKKVKEKLEELTLARMAKLAVEKAGVLLEDPESALREIIEADDDVEDELPVEGDEWEEEVEADSDEDEADEE